MVFLVLSYKLQVFDPHKSVVTLEPKMVAKVFHLPNDAISICALANRKSMGSDIELQSVEYVGVVAKCSSWMKSAVRDALSDKYDKFIGTVDALYVDPFPEWTKNSAFLTTRRVYRQVEPKLSLAWSAAPRFLPQKYFEGLAGFLGGEW